MKFRFLTLCAALIAVFAFGADGFAQETTQSAPANGGKRFGKMHRGGHGKHRGGDKLGRIMSELNLTDAQKQQQQTLIDNHKVATQTQREEMKTIWQQKRSGTALTPEQESRMKEVGLQLRESSQKLHEDLLAVLTPDQKTQLEAKKAEMRQKRQERRKMREQRSSDQPQN